jgi:glycosyltransferase involved in cell wall biosynthesis
LELVSPRAGTVDDRARLKKEISRDFPWLLEEGWRLEYWGLRPDNIRAAEDGRIIFVGPRLPRRRLPLPVVAALAWATHFGLAFVRPRAGVVSAPAPYSGIGLTLAGLARRSKPPLMVRVQGSAPSRALMVHRSRLRFQILKTIERFVLRRADLVVPMGPFTNRLALRAGVRADKILDLPFPTSWHGKTAVSGNVRRDPLSVVCAARLYHEKGIDILLRAWRGVMRSVPGARLTIAGDGPARGALEHLAAELGIDDSVRFTGWLSADAMSRFFASASIAALPSRLEEGLGMALVEAGLSGCALVGSDLGGIRDIIEPDESGLTVPPEDPSALEAALVRCLGDEPHARHLGLGARRRAERYLARRDEQLNRLRIALDSLRGGPTALGSNGTV